MSRLARVSVVLIVVAAMLGMVACERSKADVVGTTTPQTAMQPDDNGDATAVGENGTDTATDGDGVDTTDGEMQPTPTEDEATSPAETEEPQPTTVTIEEGETAEPTDEAQATPTEETAEPVEEQATETATPAPEPTAATSDGQTVHVVQRGEWVYSIARIYGVSPQAIIDANNLRSPSRVYAGQELIIPGASDTDGGDQTVHVVQRGDTLTSIARRYNTTISAIRSANNIAGDRIYAGQRLIIP